MVLRQKSKLNRDDWIAAARKVLIASGVDDVKVDRLARRMKVTRGSFYWHFRNRKDLLDALLSGWVAHKQQELDEALSRWERFGAVEVARIWLREDPTYPDFDMAIRFWARKSKAVAQAVRAIDDRWIAFLSSRFAAAGQSELESVARARVLYMHQIGYYAIGFDEDMATRLAFLPHYNKVLLGSDDESAVTAVVTELGGDRPA